MSHFLLHDVKLNFSPISFYPIMQITYQLSWIIWSNFMQNVTLILGLFYEFFDRSLAQKIS